MAPHALVIPCPLQGHIAPLMQLSQKLASKGILVTFVNTEYTHSKAIKALSSSEEETGCSPDLHNIRFAQIPDGLPLDFDRDLNPEEVSNSLDDKGSGPLEQLISKLNLEANPPVSCIISSAFLSWTFDVAKRVELPWVIFWPQSLTIFAMYIHLSDIISNGHFPPRKAADRIDYIPGLPPLETEDLPSQLQGGDLSGFMNKLVLRQFRLIHKADWIIGNNVYELESEASDAALRARAPVCSVGPLFDAGKDCKTLSLWRESDCLPWLDSKPKSSVIYVSFGSMIRMSPSQVEEIAMGLLESEASFVWVVRPDIVTPPVIPATLILPDGFLEKTRDRGLVVPWTPQVLVLSHPSIGGFFTHCGWNSTVESLSSGVPMLTFPNWYDQYTNRMLIVNQWRIGMKLKAFRDDGIVERKEISRAIRALMQSEEGNLMRRRTTELRETARQALSEGGSSLKNLQSFVDYIYCTGKKNEKGTHSTVNDIPY